MTAHFNRSFLLVLVALENQDARHGTNGFDMIKIQSQPYQNVVLERSKFCFKHIKNLVRYILSMGSGSRICASTIMVSLTLVLRPIMCYTNGQQGRSLL